MAEVRLLEPPRRFESRDPAQLRLAPFGEAGSVHQQGRSVCRYLMHHGLLVSLDSNPPLVSFPFHFSHPSLHFTSATPSLTMLCHISSAVAKASNAPTRPTYGSWDGASLLRTSTSTASHKALGDPTSFPPRSTRQTATFESPTWTLLETTLSTLGDLNLLMRCSSPSMTAW